MEKKIFDELIVRFCKIENKITNICYPAQDVGLKKWMDNQEVCDTLRISKRTLQVYRDKGLIPFHASNINFSIGRKMCSIY